jgi:hypothetical protein
MTLGLLVSRNTKNKLHKISLTNPTNENIQWYKKLKQHTSAYYGARKNSILPPN